MANYKVSIEELKVLAQKYNTEGRRAICNILQTQYEVKSPNTVIKRMRSIEAFRYDSNLDRFLFHQNESPDDVFLSMDELCTPMVQAPLNAEDVVYSHKKPQAMEKLIQELIGDRLLAISKYVIMDPLSKTVIIENTSLIAEGYQVITH